MFAVRVLELGHGHCHPGPSKPIIHWPSYRLTQSEPLTFYSPAVTICTASLTFNNSTFCPHSVYMCFVWIWEQTAIISLYSIDWLVFRRYRKLQKRRLASSCLSVRRQEQLGHLWTDFHAIRYLRIFVKSVATVEVWSQSVQCLRWRPDRCTFMITFCWTLLTMKNFQTDIVENYNTYFKSNNIFPPIILPFMG
jgi:hypothetical protein